MIHCCHEHDRHLKEGEVALIYIEEFREYGIKILDGGTSFQEIRFCPWCGARLPVSLRDEWYRRIEVLGKEPEDELPPSMHSDEWWRSEEL